MAFIPSALLPLGVLVRLVVPADLIPSLASIKISILSSSGCFELTAETTVASVVACAIKGLLEELFPSELTRCILTITRM
jgi:hypothetical protein